jgi:hypothetical protein
MIRNITAGFRGGALVLASMVLAVAFSVSGAGAAPLTAAKSAIASSSVGGSDVTLVRDGCGPGMRFSNSRQACVEAGPRYVAPGCPPGTRFSERRQACVEIGAVDPGAAIVNGIIGGVIGATAPRGCGPGMRWSNSRGRCVYN